MKKIFKKFKTLKKGTIIRTILQIAAYVNQVVAIISKSSFVSSPVYQIISLIFTIVSTAISYWKNNDWTNFAQLAGEVLDMLKDGKITKEEIQLFMAKYKEVNIKVDDVKVEEKADGVD